MLIAISVITLCAVLYSVGRSRDAARAAHLAEQRALDGLDALRDLRGSAPRSSDLEGLVQHDAFELQDQLRLIGQDVLSRLDQLRQDVLSRLDHLQSRIKSIEEDVAKVELLVHEAINEARDAHHVAEEAAQYLRPPADIQ